jgi:hypothetical protein
MLWKRNETPPFQSHRIMTLTSFPVLATTSATIGLLVGSHIFDWDYLLQCIWIECLGLQKRHQKQQQQSQQQQEPPQYTLQSSSYDSTSLAHYRFLEWYKSSNKKVTSRDVDFNLHMNNARYSRHADLVRYQALVETSYIATLRQLDPSIVSVVSAISQKFRRELSWGQQYQIWIRIIGWDERHLYIEHVFVIISPNQSTPLILHPKPRLDGSISSIRDYQTYQSQQLEPSSIASILLLRLTTTKKRTKTWKQKHDSISSSSTTETATSEKETLNASGIRHADVLRAMGITEEQLPDVLPPTDDILQFCHSLEMSSRRLMPSKL